MSDAALFIMTGIAGGLAWMLATTGATWWFNRRARADVSRKSRLENRIRRHVLRRLA